MIETIREDRLDSKKFKKWLRAQGWLKKCAGRKKNPIGTVWEDRIRLRAVTIGRSQKKESLLAALEFLTKAKAQLQDWLGNNSAAANVSGTLRQKSQNATVGGSAEGEVSGEIDAT